MPPEPRYWVTNPRARRLTRAPRSPLPPRRHCDQVVGSISELYAFMDDADATLARKVLGEAGDGAEDDGGEAAQDEGESLSWFCLP
jgi:hypothetical protein